MNILHVTDTFLPKIGGAEIALDQLARALVAMSVPTAVLAQRSRHASGPDDATPFPYPVQRFAHPRSSLWAGWWARRAIRRFAASHPFDVIIGHHSFPPGYACVRYAEQHGLPSIVYPRGGDIYHASRWRKSPRNWRKVQYALRRATRVVYASDAMGELIRQIIGPGYPDGRLVKIPNGVNPDELRADAARSRFAADERLQAPFILGLGRVTWLKGFDLLVRAFAELSPSGVNLVIAGKGPELPNVIEQARPLGDRFVSTGMVTGDDKRWLLQHCRFLVAPSREESFGNVALEAMACGKPVVAANASGFVEVVRDGENGRLFKANDVAELVAAIAAYLDRDLTAESAAARAQAELFAWPRIAQRYVDLIRSIMM